MPMSDFLRSKGKSVDFENNVQLVELAGNIKAVFKPCEEDDLRDAYAEVAAYKASRFLNIDLVPPTFMRTIDGLTGSLQLYIETDLDALDPEVYRSALAQADKDSVANLKIFCFVFGQWDTGAHNLLITHNENSLTLVAIDNSGIANRQYVRYGENPFVRMCYDERFDTHDWNSTFPFDKACTSSKNDEQALYELFGHIIPTSRCRKLARRNFKYIIFRNSLWIQFHAGKQAFSYTSYYPIETIAKLKNLTYDILKNSIFDHVTDSSFLTDEYLMAILERRDQLIAHCIMGYRDDKSARDTTTVQEVERLFENQLKR